MKNLCPFKSSIVHTNSTDNGTQTQLRWWHTYPPWTKHKKQAHLPKHNWRWLHTQPPWTQTQQTSLTSRMQLMMMAYPPTLGTNTTDSSTKTQLMMIAYPPTLDINTTDKPTHQNANDEKVYHLTLDTNTTETDKPTYQNTTDFDGLPIHPRYKQTWYFYYSLN